MLRVFSRLHSLLDVDAMKAFALYAGATLLLGLACTRDLERSANVAISDEPVGSGVVAGR